MPRDVFREVILPSAGLPEKSSYTISEVAKMFGVTRQTLGSYIRKGMLDLPIYRFAKWPRIYLVDLLKIFNRMEVVEHYGSSFDETTFR